MRCIDKTNRLNILELQTKKYIKYCSSNRVKSWVINSINFILKTIAGVLEKEDGKHYDDSISSK